MQKRWKKKFLSNKQRHSNRQETRGEQGQKMDLLKFILEFQTCKLLSEQFRLLYLL